MSMVVWELHLLIIHHAEFGASWVKYLAYPVNLYNIRFWKQRKLFTVLCQARIQ